MPSWVSHSLNDICGNRNSSTSLMLIGARKTLQKHKSNKAHPATDRFCVLLVRLWISNQRSQCYFIVYVSAVFRYIRPLSSKCQSFVNMRDASLPAAACGRRGVAAETPALLKAWAHLRSFNNENSSILEQWNESMQAGPGHSGESGCPSKPAIQWSDRTTSE